MDEDFDDIDPLLRYLLQTSSGSSPFTPLYRTLGSLMPTPALQAPEIPGVTAAGMGQPVQSEPVLEEEEQGLDPYSLYALSGMGYRGY